jgi:hypothetical protein
MRDRQRFEEFQAELVSRHEHYLTDRFATLGDLGLLVGLGLVLGRKFRATGAVTLVVGLVLVNVAHLFQPGTLGPELRAIVRHPIWALRAETHRMRKSLGLTLDRRSSRNTRIGVNRWRVF